MQFILAFAVALGVVLYVACWFAAYQSVPRIEKWSQQYAVLSPWWVFNKKLLPPEHDHWRIKALCSVVLYVAAGILLWYLRSRLS